LESNEPTYTVLSSGLSAGEDVLKPIVVVLHTFSPLRSSANSDRSSEPQNVVPSRAKAGVVHTLLPAV
jgi:hypothetical protein